MMKKNRQNNKVIEKKTFRGGNKLCLSGGGTCRCGNSFQSHWFIIPVAIVSDYRRRRKWILWNCICNLFDDSDDCDV